MKHYNLPSEVRKTAALERPAILIGYSLVYNFSVHQFSQKYGSTLNDEGMMSDVEAAYCRSNLSPHLNVHGGKEEEEDKNEKNKMSNWRGRTMKNKHKKKENEKARRGRKRQLA